MTDHAPTPEQQEALRLFATGKSLAIEAGAGTGKTSTLIMLARSTERRGQYVAFNRAIVEEAKTKFPATVNCSTAHSLAFREVGKRFKRRIDDRKRMRSSEIADRLGVSPLIVQTFLGEDKRLSAAKLAGIARATVLSYCQSGDAEITEDHVPYQRGIDSPGRGRGQGNRAIAAHVLPHARAIWRDGIDPDGELPYDFAYYLKLWERSNPRINADFILFDEAQDASPVMLSIIEQQPARVQRVFVGDSQQQIYSFTGAVNALGRIREGGGNVAFLTQSFRFGHAVAGVANRVLDDLDAELRLSGFDRIPSVVEPVADADAILTRTNAEAVRELLDALSRDIRVHLVGGGREIVAFAKGAAALQRGETTDHPDLWLFASWGEVVSFVEDDDQGGDLRLLVKLIDEFGAEKIIDALERMPREQDADLVISTAHKSKGREWDAVRLAADFPVDARDEELRLLYVAATRARIRLDVTAVGYFVENGATEIEAPEDHDDPDHDHANCPDCIQQAREADRAADDEICGAVKS